MTSTVQGVDLLSIALAWHADGCPVLPIIFRPKKHGPGMEKIPIVKEYKHWKNGTVQTVEDIHGMQDKYGNSSWQRAEGVAILLWPASERMIVDVDDAGKSAEGDRLLADAGITLPRTGLIHTRSGGRQFHFRARPGTPPPDPDAPDRDRRRIRLLHATDAQGKPCMPAVDFLFNGMTVVAGPNYHEDPDHPVDSASLAILPEEILALARKRAGPSGGRATGARKSGVVYAELLRGVPLGIQHETSTQLIGHYLPKLGPDETWALIEDWCGRCTPAADKQKVRTTFEDLVRKERQKPQNGHGPGIPCEEAPPLQVPQAGMIGLARDFATLYASHLEAPASFFYFAFLTYLGAILSRQITLQSALDIEPRLYTVLLGESADTRKTTALRKTDQFFRSLTGWEPTVLLGAGSAEGLAKALTDTPELLLHYDELKAFVSKAQAESSVLLPMVGTLFERGEYDNRVKDGSISVRGAALSLLAACTQDTYATMFDKRFHAIGFLNRLWLVADRTTAKIAVPAPLPARELDLLRQRTIALLQEIAKRRRDNTYQPVAFALTRGAATLFDAWYQQRQGSLFEKRLETYGHRLMLLLAAMTGKPEVDAEIVTAVVVLLKYQLEARRECDPVDAENTVAMLEERIRRVLTRGAMTGRDLKRKLHPERFGLWMWNTAIDNLRRNGELRWDRKKDVYWLPAVTNSVTSIKSGPNV